MELIERTKAILLKPKETWGVIKEEQTTIMELFTSYAAILAAIPPIASLIGMSLIGMSFMGVSFRIPFGSALIYAVTYYILSLLGIYVNAMVINTLAPKFDAQQNLLSAMKVSVFSTTPFWVAGVLFIIPSLSPIIMLLSLYSLYLFYLGLPVLMDIPKEKALTYVIVVIIASIIVSVLIGVVANVFLPARRAMMPY